jgi:hypothetical protein
LALFFFGIFLAEQIRTLMSRDVKTDNSLRAKDPSGADEQVMRGILNYCVEHPYAKDTPEGILKWWGLKAKSEWRREDVQTALDFLTSKGWLTKRKTIPSKEIYGINKDRLQEIRSFLLQPDGSSSQS